MDMRARAGLPCILSSPLSTRSLLLEPEAEVRAACRTYVEGLRPQDPDQSGATSLVLFGPAGEISSRLARLLTSYRLPPFASGDVACSFGIGASGAGVPWHVHGHGFAEVLHGSKAR